MANLNHKAPHVSSISAGRNKFDPVYSSIFEVGIDLPQRVLDLAGIDEPRLTLMEQVTEVGGLDALQKTTQAGSQKFMGVDVSFLNPVLDNTYAEFTITFNLNINNNNDVEVLRIFKLWSKLGYDILTGVRTKKQNYIAGTVEINQANRDGMVWRKIKFHDVMVTNVTGLDSLNYTTNDAATLQVTFRSDYWQEYLATDKEQNPYNDENSFWVNGYEEGYDA